MTSRNRGEKRYSRVDREAKRRGFGYLRALRLLLLLRPLYPPLLAAHRLFPGFLFLPRRSVLAISLHSVSSGLPAVSTSLPRRLCGLRSQIDGLDRVCAPLSLSAPLVRRNTAKRARVFPRNEDRAKESRDARTRGLSTEESQRSDGSGVVKIDQSDTATKRKRKHVPKCKQSLAPEPG